jgi:uncharacterized delta-60 repeat protein
VIDGRDKGGRLGFAAKQKSHRPRHAPALGLRARAMTPFMASQTVSNQGDFPVWFLSERETRRPAPAGACSSRFRPCLEVLEDRRLLSAGALDPTFNPAGNPPGTASVALGAVDHATGVLVQPSGKVVVTGQSTNAKGQTAFSAACFNPDGTPDTTFGSGGTVITSFKGNAVPQRGYTAALYPTGSLGDEKILEVGYGLSGQQGAFALVRYNASGSLDTAFGNGGLVVTTFKQGTSGASGVVVEPDGKIVVAGDNGSGFELARYNANGTLDKTFGTGGTGTVYTPIASGTSAGMHCLAQGANGDVIVVGQTGPSVSQSQWLLAAYSPNGTLDPSFGTNGLVYNSAFTAAEAVVVYPQTDTTGNAGKIVVGGYGGGPANYYTTPFAFDLARYNPNGTLDTTFGSGGMVTTPIGANSEAWAVAIQADGKVAAAGESEPDGTGHWQFALTRYNPDGSLDSTFGAGGIVTTSVGPVSYIRAMALQPNGDIVVAGTGNGTSFSTTGSFAVARYLASAPQVGSFTASPNPVTAGNSVTLTASNISDGNPAVTITQVAFYQDRNGDSRLEPGTDQLLGYASQTSPGVWTFTWATAGWARGSYTLFAQAQDSYGVFGDPVALSLQVL